MLMQRSNSVPVAEEERRKSSNRTKEWQTEMLTPSGESVKSLILDENN